ncbi:hypothetical protein AK830_g10789 [Neonectria ditissima]|uniref:Uncharacterized protein n=1 Tax=Neonectria ditissima TaxID=78410 RepID=A0A0P7AP37_9HYPO|nr:hypothetical protein AK830_g10789 [Neonectria ditissima]
MMRTAARRSRETAVALGDSEAVRGRPKMFIPHRTRKKVYFTLNKSTYPRKQPLDSELFQISNLLLDLDDLDSKHVRPCNNEDEYHMHRKYEVTPAQLGLETRIVQFKTEVVRSRLTAFEMSSDRASARRLANHDVLSVALRGAPASAPLIDSVEEAQRQDAGSLTASEALDPRRRLDILHTVFSSNIISDYALAHQNDELLLHWLKLRQRPVQFGFKRTQAPPSRSRFILTLEQQSSIGSIRRLVFHSLSSGLDATWFQAPPTNDLEVEEEPQLNLPSQMRRICANILNQYTPEASGALEAMAFLGNLRQRLSASGVHMAPPLCGFGLRLSGFNAKPVATLEYLNFGFKHDFWTKDAQMARDVQATLTMYNWHLAKVSERPCLDVVDRETLFQALTGVDETDEVAPTSFRSLVLYFLRYSCDGEESRQAVSICNAYLMTLGRLGAVATLWKEWRLLRGAFEMNVQTGRVLAPEDDNMMAEAFVAACTAALSVVARREDAVPADLGLAGCATLDVESIEMQKPEAWLGNQEAGPIEGFSDGETRAALDLPLDGWLDAVQRAAGLKKWSPKRVGG